MSYCGCHGSAGLELTARSAPGGAGQRQVRGLIIMTTKLHLTLLPDKLGVCRLSSGSALPAWFDGECSFHSVTVTADEVSIVCRENIIPADCLAERNFRGLKVEGPLDFSLTGILASLLNPLAKSGIAVFTISTFDTDYILVKEDNLEKAITALRSVAEIAL